jgi:hypothetical protein
MPEALSRSVEETGLAAVVLSRQGSHMAVLAATLLFPATLSINTSAARDQLPIRDRPARCLYWQCRGSVTPQERSDSAEFAFGLLLRSKRYQMGFVPGEIRVSGSYFRQKSAENDKGGVNGLGSTLRKWSRSLTVKGHIIGCTSGSVIP